MINKIFKSALAVSTALILAGCASTDIESRSVDHSISDKTSAEAGMKLEADKIEDKLKYSGNVIQDPALKAYLVNLTDAVIGDYEGQLRVYPFEAPVFNAGILPNGAMVVYSGLMLRAENEAQLALVLGHEFGHYYERHILERRAAAQNASWGSILLQTLTFGYGGIAGHYMVIAAYLDFNQEQELEADRIGLEQIDAQGYDAKNAIGLWKNLADEMAHSTNRKTRKRARKSNAVFATHPTTKERIAALETISEDMSSGTKLAQEKYRAIIRPHLQNWLEAELTRRDYGSLFHLIDRLSGLGSDLGVLNYMRGRNYATRNEAGDDEKALDAYLTATQYADAPPVVHKVLGDLYNDLGRKEDARKSFQIYLVKAPDAEDRALVEYMLETMGD